MTTGGGLPSNNYTQIPNVILDNLATISDAELRVTLFIARKTRGWQKETDELSLSQLMKGTGLSNKGVILGVQDGVKRGVIGKNAVDPTNTRKGFTYSLIVNEVHKGKSGSLVNEVHNPYEQRSQRLMNVVHTQKKSKETSQKKKKREVTNDTLLSPAPSHSLDSLSVSPTTTPLPLLETEANESPPITAKRRKTQPPDVAAPPSHADHPYVAIYRQTFHRYPGKAQMAQLATMATTPQGEGRFKAACAAWLMAGYKPNNLRGILDWYRDGVPDYQAANPNAHTRPVPKPKPTATSPYATMTDAERAAYLASCEPIEDDYDDD